MELELRMSHTGPDGGLHYWLLDSGDAVAYAKVYERTESSGTVVELCDIETRKEFRNRGHATAILNAIAEGYSIDRISHGGSYTPDGFSYIASKLERTGHPALKANCSPMSFVENWDQLLPKYP